jgi:hypothetical protein
MKRLEISVTREEPAGETGKFSEPERAIILFVAGIIRIMKGKDAFI